MDIQIFDDEFELFRVPNGYDVDSLASIPPFDGDSTFTLTLFIMLLAGF